MDLISSLSVDVVNKALDGLSKRNTAIASNLANVDTPGYNRRTVNFEGALQRAIQHQTSKDNRRQASNDTDLGLRTTRPEHFSIPGQSLNINEVNPQIEEVKGMEYRNDGNSVDVESEMAQLAKNTGRYIALANIENRMLKSMKTVINSSGGV